jgi:ABC-2 type transport system ATP-binding protein
MAMSDIEIKNHRKTYETLEAVKGVSFSVNPAELFGLIGPDGAGKTTLIRSICTLLTPTEGEIFLKNYNTRKDIRAIRKILGYMPQRFSLYQDLTVEQNLKFFADLFQVPGSERTTRLKQLYSFSRLEPFKKRKAGDLSGGMKQKLALSCALIHTPEILILDEPTFGVDPVSRQEFWDILKLIQKEGTTILVSTAYMDEAELCDRIALMHQGVIKKVGTPETLKSQSQYFFYRLTGEKLHQIYTYFMELKESFLTQLFGDSIHASFLQNPPESDWIKWKEEISDSSLKWAVHTPSIEDIFMEITAEAE